MTDNPLQIVKKTTRITLFSIKFYWPKTVIDSRFMHVCLIEFMEACPHISELVPQYTLLINANLNTL